MELNIPGCTVSPRSLKSHMTAPQHTAAKIENWAASGGSGRVPAAGGADEEYGVFARERKAATTREQTYSTIWRHASAHGGGQHGAPHTGTRLLTCSFTALRSPKTTYPPMRPAMNVSKPRSLPPFIFFCTSSSVLYSDTNFARFSACCFVAR